MVDLNGEKGPNKLGKDVFRMDAEIDLGKITFFWSEMVLIGISSSRVSAHAVKAVTETFAALLFNTTVGKLKRITRG
jgi:hypothetical protein